MSLRHLRIGYRPYSPGLSAPGDRRRFVYYLRSRDIPFEIADPHRAYDLVYLTASADLTKWKHYDKGRVVFELVDSYLALPPLHPKQVLRGLAKFTVGDLSRPILSYERALRTMAQRAHAVVCSTQEQKEVLESECPNVHVILDFHDEFSGHKNSYARGEVLNLVWEGMGQNAAAFNSLAPVLHEINRQTPIALHLVTDLVYKRFLNKLGTRHTDKDLGSLRELAHLHQWSAANVTRVVTSSDLALIPLTMSDPFKAGKPANKLFAFWRMGMPTVTSASPAYVRAMRAADSDHLACSTEAEWKNALTLLAFNEDARKDAAEKGRRYVESTHSTTHLLAAWDRMVHSVLDHD